MQNLYLFFFLVFILNLFFILKFNFYSRFFNIYDSPDGERKFHNKKTKVLGGTLILTNLILYFLYFYLFDKVILLDLKLSKKELIIFLTSLFLIYLIGLVDDKKNLPAINKFFLLSLVISISLLSNKNYINYLEFSFFSKIYIKNFSFFLTLFCYLIFINSFNMLDGINLQAGMYSCFLTIFLIINGLNFIFSIVILISLLTYIKLNYDNKVFLGDNGTLMLGYIFSYFFIKLYNSGQINFADDILLVMLLPGLEITRLIFERTINNKNILKGDRNHIHHLINFKNYKYLSVFLIQLFAILPYAISIFFKNNLVIILFFTLLYFIIIFKLKKKKSY